MGAYDVLVCRSCILPTGCKYLLVLARRPGFGVCVGVRLGGVGAGGRRPAIRSSFQETAS